MEINSNEKVIAGLIEGQAYKVTYTWTKRAVTRTFLGYCKLDEVVEGEPTGKRLPVMDFYYSGGHERVNNEHITKIEEAKAKPAKKKDKVCNRCNGAKYLEHVKHVEGGRCFKCGGTGLI